jgi:hypothetical protein
LIVIIALGECLIVAAAGLTDASRSLGTVALAVGVEAAVAHPDLALSADARIGLGV